jgi:hypothetical protein
VHHTAPSSSHRCRCTCGIDPGDDGRLSRWVEMACLLQMAWRSGTRCFVAAASNQRHCCHEIAKYLLLFSAPSN